MTIGDTLLSLLRFFFPEAAPAGPVHETPAFRIMRQFNHNGLIGAEGRFVHMIEDHRDPDGRLYRLEYVSTRDGRHAIAYCRYKPWPNGSPHLLTGGLICIGPGGHNSDTASSSYGLQYVIPRARYWCTATSVYQETGEFPD